MNVMLSFHLLTSQSLSDRELFILATRKNSLELTTQDRVI